MNVHATGHYLTAFFLVGFLMISSTVLTYGSYPSLVDPTLTVPPVLDSNSKTILIEKEGKIWKLNPESLVQELYLDIQLRPELQLGDMYPTRDGKYIFAIVGTKTDPIPKTFAPTQNSEENQLLQIDLYNGAKQVVWTSPFLGRMSPLSPDGTKTILSSVDISKHEDSNCVFDNITKNCAPIDTTIDINSDGFFWLDNATFAALTDDSVDIYSVGQGSPSKRSFPLGSVSVGSAVMTPLPKTSKLVIGRNTTPRFVSVDLATSQVSGLNYSVADDYFAAFTHIGISSDGQYLWYTRANHLNVVDFKTGLGLATLDEIAGIVWVPGSQDFIGVMNPQKLQ
jgi:hypothetical protein